MGKLIFIGLGLYNGKDVSIKGLEIMRNVDIIFAEFYTSIMASGTIKSLEGQIKKPITILTRSQVEDGSEIILQASENNVAFLTQGDPLTATTHIDLLLQAKDHNITTQVIHGASITTCVPGLLGLQFYKFGRTTTLAYPEDDYFPESPYDIIVDNQKAELHTLVLLDIQANENRYMSANEGIEILLTINSKRNDDVFTAKTLTCAVARAGSEKPVIVANEASKLLTMDFGKPLHTLIIPGKLHFKEAEALIKLANAPQELINKKNASQRS